MTLRATGVRLRIDARRPASWLAVVGAGAASWAAAGVAPFSPAAAVLLGGLLAAAAVGGPWRGPAGEGSHGVFLRAAWPAAGILVGWIAAGAPPAAFGTTATLLVSCMAATLAIEVAGRLELPPADATRVAAVAAAGAGLAAATLPAAWAPAVAWLATVTAATVVDRFAWLDPGGRRGPGGIAMSPAVMVSALAGMVLFLLLAPHLAWGYPALAAVWLVADAVPRATLGPGAGGDAARRILVATAPGRSARPAAAAARLLVAYAAVLCWPPLVAAAVAGSTAAAGVPLLAAGFIAAAAGGLAAVAAGALACGASRETALALALVAVGAGIVGAEAAASRAETASPRATGLMLSNPGDPARLPPKPREVPRVSQSPRGVASCPDSPPPASSRRPEPWRRSSSC